MEKLDVDNRGGTTTAVYAKHIGARIRRRGADAREDRFALESKRHLQGWANTGARVYRSDVLCSTEEDAGFTLQGTVVVVVQ